jgi:hypothetical protein
MAKKVEKKGESLKTIDETLGSAETVAEEGGEA